jgi:hypothetical protein
MHSILMPKTEKEQDTLEKTAGTGTCFTGVLRRFEKRRPGRTGRLGKAHEI